MRLYNTAKKPCISGICADCGNPSDALSARKKICPACVKKRKGQAREKMKKNPPIKQCIDCGSDYPLTSPSRQRCDACAKRHKKEKQAIYNQRARAREKTDPEYKKHNSKLRNDWIKKKRETDPVFAEKRREKNREYAREVWNPLKEQRKQDDPEYRKYLNNLLRVWRNKKLATDPVFAAKYREYHRQYGIRYREEQLTAPIDPTAPPAPPKPLIPITPLTPPTPSATTMLSHDRALQILEHLDDITIPLTEEEADLVAMLLLDADCDDTWTPPPAMVPIILDMQMRYLA